MSEEPEFTDEEVQEHWDKLVAAGLRVGVIVDVGDKIIMNKEFHEHINSMLKQEMMEIRMVIMHEIMDKYDMLSPTERAWMVSIGDFMLANKKFPTEEENDWYDATQLIVSMIEMEAEEQGVKLEV